MKPLKPLTVAALIEHLNTFDQDLPVAYALRSENCILEADDIKVEEFCEMRPDGWVPNKRPDKPTRLYLSFPGN